MTFYDAETKNTAAVLDYERDWSTWLGEDTISTSTWIVPGGITVNNESHTPTAATIWLSGGTEGRDYELINRVTTAGGRTEEARVLIIVTPHRRVPVGPPYISVAEAYAYQPAAEGEEPVKVKAVINQASAMVARLAPKPKKPTPGTMGDVLSEAMDATQDTIPVSMVERWPDEGIVLIDNELIHYSRRTTVWYEQQLELESLGVQSAPSFAERTWTLRSWTNPLSGLGTLEELSRGINATTPATHSQGAAVAEVSYPLMAHDAELAVFEWLWATRGWKPSRTGVVGSESYSIDYSQIRELVRQSMGRFYTGGLAAGAAAGGRIVSAKGRSR